MHLGSENTYGTNGVEWMSRCMGLNDEARLSRIMQAQLFLLGIPICPVTTFSGYEFGL